MEMNHTLVKIERILHAENMDCSIITPIEADPSTERLLVHLGIDTHERERILEITVQEQVLPNQESNQYTRIQFQVLLPFKVIPSTANELAAAVAFINSIIEMPGFEYREIDNAASYRYVYLAHGVPESTLLLSIVGLILINIDLYSEPLESVATGKTTLYELLEKANELIKKEE